MNHPAILDIEQRTYSEILKYVLPRNSRHEEAVFVFARADSTGVFTPLEVFNVPPSGFVHRSPYFLELTDETRATVIKRGHDLTASVIEIHSHPLQFGAQFSQSDISGFREFVPHILWRLKKRPYAAVVVARDSIDSLAWFDTVESPVPMAIRYEDGTLSHPTGATHSTCGQEQQDYE